MTHTFSIFLFPCFLCCLPSNAQQRDTVLQTEIQGEAQVVYRKNRSMISADGFGESSWSMKELQNLPQILGNADPLRYAQFLPAVQTSSEYDAGLHVQGCASGQNAIRMGQAVIYNPSHLLGIFSTFNASHFPSLQISTYSRIDQPNRVGGILTMRLPNHEPADSVVSAEGGIGLLSSQGTLHLPLGSKSHLTISARQAYLNLLYSRWLEIDDTKTLYGFGDYNLTFSHRNSPRHRFLMNLYYGQDRVHYDDASILVRSSLHWQNLAAEARSEYREGRFALTQSLTFSGYRNRFNLDQDVQHVALPSHIGTWAYHAQLAIGGWTAGADCSLHSIQPQSPETKGSYSSIYNPVPSERASEISAYGQWRKDLANGQQELVLGLRGTMFRSPDHHSFLSAAPSASWLCRIGYSHSVALRAGINYQYLHQTGFTSLGLPTEFWFSSTRKQQPQRSESLSLAYKGQLLGGRYAITAEAWCKWLHKQKEYQDNVLDILNSAYSLDEALLQGRGMNYGFGIQLTKQTGPLTGWLAYSFGRSLRWFAINGTTGRYPSSYERQHEAKLVCTFRMLPRLTLTGTAVAASGTPFTMPESFYLINGYIVTQYGRRNSKHLPFYKRIDLAANFDFKQRRNVRHGLNLSLYNAFGFNNNVFYRLSFHDSGFSMSGVSFLEMPLPSLSYYLKF